MIAEPPLSVGATQVNDTWPFPAVATTFDEAAATVRGVAAADVADAPLPAAFTGMIRTRTAVPFVKPVITAVVPVTTLSAEKVAPLSVLYATRYPLMAEPPLEEGAVQLAVTWLSAAVTTRLRTALAVANGTATSGVDALPAPPPLTARTRNA